MHWVLKGLQPNLPAAVCVLNVNRPKWAYMMYLCTVLNRVVYELYKVIYIHKSSLIAPSPFFIK